MVIRITGTQNKFNNAIVAFGLYQHYETVETFVWRLLTIHTLLHLYSSLPQQNLSKRLAKQAWSNFRKKAIYHKNIALKKMSLLSLSLLHAMVHFMSNTDTSNLKAKLVMWQALLGQIKRIIGLNVMPTVQEKS